AATLAASDSARHIHLAPLGACSHAAPSVSPPSLTRGCRSLVRPEVPVDGVLAAEAVGVVAADLHEEVVLEGAGMAVHEDAVDQARGRAVRVGTGAVGPPSGAGGGKIDNVPAKPPVEAAGVEEKHVLSRTGDLRLPVPRPPLFKHPHPPAVEPADPLPERGP